jgi:hypothetical protein
VEALRRRVGWLVPAVAALAAQWLLHLAVPRAPFAPFSLGERLVRQAPGGLATAAIDLLGHQALYVVAAMCVAGALALGFALRRATPRVLGGAALVASLGAAWLDPRGPGPPWALAAGAVAALAAVLAPLAVAARPGRQQPGRRAGRVTDPGRRRLLAGIALAAGAAVLGGAAARRVLEPAQAGGSSPTGPPWSPTTRALRGSPGCRRRSRRPPTTTWSTSTWPTRPFRGAVGRCGWTARSPGRCVWPWPTCAPCPRWSGW